MAVRMRLARMGRKKKPFYRIVVTDSRSPRDGRYIECVGTYNPLINPPNIQIQEDKVNYWLDQGVIPTDTVGSLLRQKGVMLKRHLQHCHFDNARIDEELKKWEVMQIERLRRKEERDQEKKREKKAMEKVEQKTEEAPSKEDEQLAAEGVDLKEEKIEETDKKKESPDEDQLKEKADSEEAEVVPKGDVEADLKKGEGGDKLDSGGKSQEPEEAAVSQAEEGKVEEPELKEDQDDDKVDSDKESLKTEEAVTPQPEDAKDEKAEPAQIKKDKKDVQSKTEGKGKKEKDAKSQKGKNKKEDE
ncbi:30S ribosomal protein S16 [bacterium]|nr:30S ribosomal protein S16 [bacterium]